MATHKDKTLKVAPKRKSATVSTATKSTLMLLLNKAMPRTNRDKAKNKGGQTNKYLSIKASLVR